MLKLLKIVPCWTALLLCAAATTTTAQTEVPPVQHDHAAMQANDGWHLMQDGAVFFTFNHQGGDRGGDELAVQNWWMGMAERPAGRGRLKLSLMFSLEPATLGRDGYRELFQAGETANDQPLIDHQHPHDFLMQAAVAWRTPIGRDYWITLAGAPVGEPALGPVAFMHRASAFENPSAPLSHHTFDSTHITMGVLTAGIDRRIGRGTWQVEGSIFHGAEPDEQRWDLMDPGALDSWSVRGIYRPNGAWAFQASHGLLTNPEASEPGNVRRTTASATWLRSRPRGRTAVTAAYGRNNEEGGDFNAFLAEASHDIGATTVYTRVESLQVEGDLLRFGNHGVTEGRKNAHVPETGTGRLVVSAVTIGGTRTIGRPRGWDVAAGADVSFYGVPADLKPLYGDRPVSAHVFLRLRPPAPTGRMLEVTMTGR